jgi:hypothetical protein
MATPQPNLDKKSTNELNLSVLQRFDPDVEDVLVTAGHVALYAMNTECMQWVRHVALCALNTECTNGCVTLPYTH